MTTNIISAIKTAHIAHYYLQISFLYLIRNTALKPKAALKCTTCSQWPKLTSRWQHSSLIHTSPTTDPKLSRGLCSSTALTEVSVFVCIQFCRHLILSEKGHVDWKLMFFTLQKYYPQKEHYGDTLQFCKHCSILFWKVCYMPRSGSDVFKAHLAFLHQYYTLTVKVNGTGARSLKK